LRFAALSTASRRPRRNPAAKCAARCVLPPEVIEPSGMSWRDDPIGFAYILCLGVTVGLQLACFAVAAALQFDKITDLAGSLNFVVLAVLTLLLAEDIGARQIVVSCLVAVSRTELAAFLLYRVLQRGKDARFDTVRERPLVFLIFWVWQMLWVFVVSSSVIFINSAGHLASPTLSAADYVGWALFGLGFAVQVVADVQKYLFRADQANRRRVCDRGLWRFSRHPNFCGEVLLWIGVYVAGAPVFRAAPVGWWTVASPLFTLAVLTLFTGIPQAEGQNAVRWYDGGEAQAQYEVYFERTPPLWLLPPQLYRLLPRRAKLLLCCELPLYAYRPSSEPVGGRSASSGLGEPLSAPDTDHS